jgi:agarase
MVLVSSAHGQEPSAFDQYGGLKDKNFGPGKCFRTHNDGERWWLVTPDGGAFLSLGVCNVNPEGDVERGTNRQPYRENVLKKHGSAEQWTAATRDRFREWGLNTLGNWSSQHLRGTVPYTVELSVNPGGWGRGTVPDFFDPKVYENIRQRGAAVDAYVDDPWLVGYFLDNELPWAYDWRRFPSLFPGYMAMAPERPGKQRLVEFFKERYGTPEAFAKVWNVKLADWADLAGLKGMIAVDSARADADREAFVLLAAREYFKAAAEGIRSKDREHLVLGCRFVWALVPKPVVQACGEYCDAVSINYYEAGPVGDVALGLTNGISMRLPKDLSFKAFFEAAKKPLMVTEFSFRGMDSGQPNSFPPGWLLQPNVATQQDRADKFEHCVNTWLSTPYFVGYHWFEWVDEPKGGRFDGEDGNYGLVNLADDPYGALVERFSQVNRRAWDLHARSGK